MSWGKRADMIVHEEDPYNAEPPTTALAEAALTPVPSFYSRNHGPVAELDPAAWTLLVDGDVETPLRLGLADLQQRFAPRTLVATLQCAGNRRAGLLEVAEIPGEAPWGRAATSTAEWTGVALAEVLAAAGVRPSDSAHVAFCAPDVSELASPPQAYGGSVPLTKALAPEVLLAWAMNGEPLTAVHGAPVRVVVPGYIGARSVKWVQRITVQDAPSDNYFQATAYRVLPPGSDPSAAGPGDGISLASIALSSAILRPVDGADVPAGPLEVVGYALAGDDRSVARVDVSGDGGTTWVQAELTADGRWAWSRWRAVVEVDPGPARVVARAWDSTGALQPRSPADVWNPKGYVNNSWDAVELNAVR